MTAVFQLSIEGRPTYRNGHRHMRIGSLVENKYMPRSGRRCSVGKSLVESGESPVSECETMKKTAVIWENLSIYQGNMFIGNKQDIIDNSMAILVLDDNGLIQHCNRRVCMLLGRQVGSLIWRHVSTVITQLTGMVLISNDKINPRLQFLAQSGHRFEVVGRHGIHFKCKLFFIHKKLHGQHCLQVIICPVEIDT